MAKDRLTQRHTRRAEKQRTERQRRDERELVALACAALAAGVGEWAAAASVSKSHASLQKENRP